MDILGDILDVLKFKGSLYFTTAFGAPWGVKVPHYSNAARFHLVAEGPLSVNIEGLDKPLILEQGDFLIIPHGTAHEMRDSLESDIIDLDDAQADGTFDENGQFVIGNREADQVTKLVCGHFEFDDGFQHPIIGELPSHILIKREEAEKEPWFYQALMAMANEAGDSKLGYSEILKRMSEILFIHTVRIWSQRELDEPSFLSAMADPRVGRSLRTFHMEPGKRWTVDDLAKEAGMSRTAFSQTFTELTKSTPMQYVTNWRVQKSQRMLIETSEPIDDIAANVGYESLAAFSRVFKRSVGVGPGKYRREQQTS